MSRVWQIIVREYVENVRTKAFLIGVVLTPLWFGLVFLTPLIADTQEKAPQRVAIVDRTGVLGEDLRRALEGQTSRAGRPLYVLELVDLAAEGGESEARLDALRGEAAHGERLVIILTPPVLQKRDAEAGEEAGAILHAASAGPAETAQLLKGVVNEIVNRRIVVEKGIDPEDLRVLARDAIEVRPLTRTGEKGGIAQFVTPMVFMLFLFMGIVGISQMLVNSTIEEKASRVYEVLLSSVSPVQLMSGKIIGICGVGFTLMALWIGGGLAAAAIQGHGELVSTSQLGLFVAYYVLGFFLIASLMVAVGSACNTLKEAQNLMAPLSMLLALPLLLSIVVLRNPNGAVATIGSFIPPFTPFLMMARVANVPGPPTWQIVVSLLLLAVATWLAIRLAARVFRVGILMYGKPPRFSEVLRWLRDD